MRRGTLAGALAAVALLAAATTAHAAPQPYQANDFKGFWNVIPPGENGTFNVPQFAQFQLAGTRPPHIDDQLAMYRDLPYATPGLKPEDIGKYYKDASFGVRPEDVERTENPKPGVTIQRDKFGVPHIYGDTRADVMYGAGYAVAEDRLAEIDILRHVARGEGTKYLKGLADASANDRDQWVCCPYKEEDLQRQVDQFPILYGTEGAQLKQDALSGADGINDFIKETKTDPSKLDSIYVGINGGQPPDPWKPTDLIALASFVGGLFGEGGGGELGNAQVLQEARLRFGQKRGLAAYRDFRSSEDPEAPETVFKQKFPYEAPPKKRAKGSLAMPDPGSVKRVNVEVSGASAASAARARAAQTPEGRNLQRWLDALHARRGTGMSNALLASSRESRSGHPLAVFGPQTGYQTPQLLYEEDLHGPGVDARGVAFAGTNLFVQIGRGQDYAWSATSAGQDIIDSFALELCETDGKAPTTSSMHYLYRGQCRDIESLDRDDTTPTGGPRFHAERTALGLVEARATVGGKPVVFVKLRSTYLHEVDSGIGIARFNDPGYVHDARSFQRAASKIGYTFNWFYADSKHIAYFNSGNNPVRAKGVNPDFPVWGKFEWRGWNPDDYTAQYTPFKQHPQVIDQSYLVNWNNKQAHGFRAADGNWEYQSVDRSHMLEDKLRNAIAGRRKITLAQLIDVMSDASTTDLRAYKVLPWALRVIGPARNVTDTRQREAVDLLTEWVNDGAHRRDRNRDGTYEHSQAIQILDAWWPLWMRGEFGPVLGSDLFKGVEDQVGGLDNEPNFDGTHVGSAYDNGFYGYARKDLRTVIGGKTKRRVRGRYSRVYCGGGSLKACRQTLLDTLSDALGKDRSDIYKDETCSSQPTFGPSDPARKPLDQECYDAIHFLAIGLAELPMMPWQNRPTFQQAVEVQGHR